MVTKIKVPNDISFQECISGDGADDYDFELEGASDWTQDYKYQWRDVILHRRADDTYWSYTEGRTGSAFSEYHYEDSYSKEITLVKVKKVEYIAERWQPTE